MRRKTPQHKGGGLTTPPTGDGAKYNGIWIPAKDMQGQAVEREINQKIRSMASDVLQQILLLCALPSLRAGVMH
ncbi:MAG: hypothetical protein FVQ85_09010 [Planctomycetes bacterium]|nr:hypothetical protein [Planctomycetota bacterium]